MRHVCASLVFAAALAVGWWRAPAGAAGLVAWAACVIFGGLLAWLIGTPLAPAVDPAWKATGYTYRFTGTDEAKQDAARVRLAKHDKARREVADARTRSTELRQFPRKAAR